MSPFFLEGVEYIILKMNVSILQQGFVNKTSPPLKGKPRGEGEAAQKFEWRGRRVHCTLGSNHLLRIETIVVFRGLWQQPLLRPKAKVPREGTGEGEEVTLSAQVPVLKCEHESRQAGRAS